MQCRRRKLTRALTLIEILSVLLIFATLMSAALVVYLSATADADYKACRGNMQAIANAEEQRRMKDPAHTYATNLGDLSAEIALPKCPDGGAYSASVDNNGNLTITCSYNQGQAGAHGSFALGVNNE